MLQVDFLKCFQEKPVWKKNFNLIYRLIVNNQDLTNMYPCACLDLLIIFIAITDRQVVAVENTSDPPEEPIDVKLNIESTASTSNVNNICQVASTTVSPVSTNHSKSTPCWKWDIKYKGNSGSLSLNSFLEKVSEYQISRNVGNDQLFAECLDLFQDHALIYVRSVKNEVNSWPELVRLLKLQFQPVDFDDKLLEQIHKTNPIRERTDRNIRSNYERNV
ncbi:hypothetical protein RN001_012932 [Aquatica leii]|uniref:Uncharacterized protein n=1 Tax=Aquatica leii TaxID=1421715 RepID=A0AAN7SC50_9COLE|nr:hypothetical protein RN001_012932 [Aquatica leii]